MAGRKATVAPVVTIVVILFLHLLFFFRKSLLFLLTLREPRTRFLVSSAASDTPDSIPSTERRPPGSRKPVASGPRRVGEPKLGNTKVYVRGAGDGPSVVFRTNCAFLDGVAVGCRPPFRFAVRVE